MPVIKKKVLVLVPTYNEADNIEAVVLAILDVATDIPKYQLEILVIDDNSPDGTGKIVQKLKHKHPCIYMIKSQKEGLGKAYIRGFKYGLKVPSAYYAFVMMDADFSHNPAAIPSMLNKIERKEDYVIGSRYVAASLISWRMRSLV